MWGLPASGILMARGEDPDPWLDQNTMAIVRIEVGGRSPDIGTGFIIRGKKSYYVITATHVLHKDPGAVKPGCTIFEGKLIQGHKGGPILGHEQCSLNLSHEVSLIKLRDRPNGYPVLTLTSRQPRRRDRVFIAGFPRGDELDYARAGWVTIPTTTDGFVGTDMLTMEGFSGGPYLTENGTVIGVHYGGVANRGGFAYFTSIASIRTQLTPLIGPISADVPQQTPPNSLAKSVSQEATLGMVLAFQYVLPPKRLQAWQVFMGRNPTTEEQKFLDDLAYVPVPSEARTIVPSNLGSETSSRDELSLDLKAAAALASIACAGDKMTIKNALIDCGTTSSFTASPNAGGRNVPVLLVFHSSYTPNLSSTLRIFYDPKWRATPHVLIDRNGSFRQLVPFDRAAAHAGLDSKWGNLSGLNVASIGIDFINRGELTRRKDGKYYASFGELVPASEVDTVTANGKTVYWHKYTAEQIATAITISKKLKAAYPIQAVVGHCQISSRKQDPGPGFPMNSISLAVISQPADNCAL
jgi:N-acetyl-anhydromuramyl-L-alanine amidase AmpD/V8-like Glu-specific endopeptidase